MLVAASRPMAEMNQWPPPLLPGDDLWRNVATAIEQQNIGLALCQLAARLRRRSPSARCCSARWPASRSRSCASAAATSLFAITIGTMMIPPSLGVVPLYSIMADLGLAGDLCRR